MKYVLYNYDEKKLASLYVFDGYHRAACAAREWNNVTVVRIHFEQVPEDA